MRAVLFATSLISALMTFQAVDAILLENPSKDLGNALDHAEEPDTQPSMTEVLAAAIKKY